MTIVAAVLAMALVLTLVFGYRYIDNIRIEQESDVYERGWTNGYEVGSKFSDEKYDRGWEDGYQLALLDPKNLKKPAKAPVKKKAKKISTKEN